MPRSLCHLPDLIPSICFLQDSNMGLAHADMNTRYVVQKHLSRRLPFLNLRPIVASILVSRVPKADD